ncbi:kinesin motor domain protein, partial [Ancylostoma duodenale]
MDGSSSSSMLSSRGGDVPSTVQVALRIRPQGNREKLEGSRVCTSVIPGEPQVTIGTDRSFTYDHVFDQATQQHEIYDSCIEKLVNGLFDGFNATVLAYGQTGSGKTYTMGTAFDTGAISEHEVGVIPRALAHVFRRIIELRREAQENGILEPAFDVSVQFIELYNEEIIDLLANDRASSLNIRIHEDNRGEIYLHGVTSKGVHDLHSTLEILKNGALNRTVAATNMNEQSSRSHAIFSLHIKQQRVAVATETPTPGQEIEMELLSAKFHFVDLAGSERLKRTGATGDRAKEGISINCGLVTIGTDRSFTYDHVFDQATQQHEIYDSCIEKLVNGLFDGFNATVLAYGQTGSGKTYTMGTAFDTGAISEHEVGVIPRALAHVFRRIIELRREAQENGILEPTFDVSVQFIELYNEEIIDLLANDRASSLNIRIHEDNRGEIYLHGVTSKGVHDLHSTLEILKNGALNRTVAATNMNEQSSRSHAIFSLHIKQQRVAVATETPTPGQEIEMELLSAKFHFVDLAGSERLKRTGATGDRAKEGISINCGL